MTTEFKIVHISVPACLLFIGIALILGKQWGEYTVWGEAKRVGVVSYQFNQFDGKWKWKWNTQPITVPIMPVNPSNSLFKPRSQPKQPEQPIQLPFN